MVMLKLSDTAITTSGLSSVHEILRHHPLHPPKLLNENYPHQPSNESHLQY
jgi:hypothetical protein